MTKEERETLIEIMLEIKNKLCKKHYSVFICNVAHQLYYMDEMFTRKEYDLFINWFHKQRPTSRKHFEFYKNDLFLKGKTEDAWFGVVADAIGARKIRIKLLTKLISELKTKL